MNLRSKVFALALLSAACATPSLARSGFTVAELDIIDQKWPTAKVTTTGLRYVVQQEGTGETPKPGDRVRMRFKGMFFDGRVFDQTNEIAGPFVFRVGRGEVIDGWDEAVATMRTGEKRILLIPYELAYGSRGQPPRIPRQTSLIFEVELLGFDANPVTAPGTAKPSTP